MKDKVRIYQILLTAKVLLDGVLSAVLCAQREQLLFLMIPVLLAGLLMIYNFVVFTSNNGSSIQNPF